MNVNMICENLAFFRDDDVENDHPFTFLARDREVVDGERWVYLALSSEEADRLRVLLDECFK